MEPSVADYPFYLAADVARHFYALGLRCSTSSALRAAIAQGRLSCTGRTPGGVHVWTRELMHSEGDRLVRQERAKREVFEAGRVREEAQG